MHLFHERMWLEAFEAQIFESMKQKDEGNRGTSWKSNPLQGVGEVVWSIPFYEININKLRTFLGFCINLFHSVQNLVRNIG